MFGPRLLEVVQQANQLKGSPLTSKGRQTNQLAATPKDNAVRNETRNKFVIIAVAFLACAFADVSELGAPGYDYAAPAAAAPVETYVPPAPAPAPVETYIPPAPPAPAYIPPAPVQAEESVVEEIEQPAEDGYRYKTVRRRVFRHRA
ncbi:uncharacterized protein LOC6646170 [Drosophila willistoni]|uniref:uncharacterized protein LOC6646170 n=1 Tax=Drosophila willistoni TaxID=7260 RepID=UPI000C26CAC8|nr:uncharacterized protein LOC6646170 [Drosophila willistoni]